MGKNAIRVHLGLVVKKAEEQSAKEHGDIIVSCNIEERGEKKENKWTEAVTQ